MEEGHQTVGKTKQLLCFNFLILRFKNRSCVNKMVIDNNSSFVLVIDDSESQGLVNGYSLTLGNGHGLVVCWFAYQVNKSLLFYQHAQKM